MDTIVAFDWPRVFMGDEPPLFLLEILLRVLVIWLWTMILLRWVGGRSLSQLSLVEFLLVIRARLSCRRLDNLSRCATDPCYAGDPDGRGAGQGG
ncbi:MAG: putative transrane protein [Cypionkella sp.]|uniref:hypothetical protein n=1 Tax=Cypionkella sp. TaxID=2811411 RepID=UPI00260AADB9|nr:hypothetical protein [Cypionkella sp.]MDB5660611.1 putative transrane protein [Cypionkella sp.]